MKLIIWNVISLLVIISGELFETEIKALEYGKICFYILNIISSSFLASSIFYFIQSYLPQKYNEKKSFIGLWPNLLKLEKELNFLVYWFHNLIDFKDDDYYIVKNPNKYPKYELSDEVIHLFIDIKRRIQLMRNTNLLNNLDLDLNMNLNIISDFIEEELEKYNNKNNNKNSLDNIIFGTFPKRFSEVKKSYYFIKEYKKNKEKYYNLKISNINNNKKERI